jgi:arylsulfatase A-like enzyme
MPERPNILWICTDQQFAGALGCAGNDDIETPNLDRLAARGVRFEEAYCADPVCVPSRASMVTGRPPHETGVTANGEALPAEYHHETLGVLLDDAGYDCGYGGKWHVPGLDVETAGFERLCEKDDHRLAGACIEFLERDRDAPFLLAAHFDNPHNICEWARGQNLPWGDIERPPVEECPPLPANFHIPPFEPDVLRRETRKRTKTMGSMADATPEEWRQYRHAYYRLVETVDTELGRILTALDEEGVTEDTVVIFTSDHGDGNGAHQVNQKWLLYEEETRVPLIVAGPGTADGAVDDHLVSTGLDLLPTLCDYGDTEPPSALQGRSIRPLAAGRAPDDWRDRVVIETYDPIEGRAVRTDRYKYIVYRRGRGREQLFDLRTDRGEMVDLSVDADYADVLAEHRDLLLEWCVDTGDIFAERYPEGAPLIPGRDLEELRQYIETHSESTLDGRL